MNLNETLAQLKQELADMQAALAAPVLDGTPYVLITTKEGVDCWYGQPRNKPKGFHSYVWYGHNQAGLITFGSESAMRAVATCAKEGLEVRFVHWRELMAVDATRLPNVITALENALANLPA